MSAYKLISLEGIFTSLKGLKKIGFSFFFLLILVSSFFASRNGLVCCCVTDFASSAEAMTAPEIQNPIQPIYLEIEISNYSHTITEVHRLVSVLIQSNRIVPINYDFRSISFILAAINYSSHVSIFIKGHALLN